MKYRAVLQCASCDAVINETDPMTAKKLWDNHAFIAISSVFAGDCPKGCRPTFSDCNMRTRMTYRRENGEQAEWEEIKARAVEERTAEQ